MTIEDLRYQKESRGHFLYRKGLITSAVFIAMQDAEIDREIEELTCPACGCGYVFPCDCEETAEDDEAVEY